MIVVLGKGVECGTRTELYREQPSSFMAYIEIIDIFNIYKYILLDRIITCFNVDLVKSSP